MENGKDQEARFVVLRSNRRKNLRKQLLVLKIKGEDTRGTFFGYAKTISRGGMFIASVNPRKVGEEFGITFSLDDGESDIKCRCVVVWQREYEPHKPDPGMGIKFIDLNEAARDRIDKWVNSK
ncbi:MAG: PilZ domain-containing protein [Deltaproteobacteria bacterium]|nr:PilZ domain-containing protein [Deltaproteobacteria bacterium]